MLVLFGKFFFFLGTYLIGRSLIRETDVCTKSLSQCYFITVKNTVITEHLHALCIVHPTDTMHYKEFVKT